MDNRKEVLDKVEAVYEKSMEGNAVTVALDALKFMYEIHVVMPGTLDSPKPGLDNTCGTCQRWVLFPESLVNGICTSERISTNRTVIKPTDKFGLRDERRSYYPFTKSHEACTQWKPKENSK